MDSIRIKNLHCLSDTGEVPLKAINVLVGANSSGKSSFLRTFPLLKQGLNTNKKGPILWLSEDVDFGDFKTAVKKGEKQIELGFNVDGYSVNLKIIGISLNDYISHIDLIFADQNIKLEINSKSEVEAIIINGETFSKNICRMFTQDNRLGILPNLIYEDPESADKKGNSLDSVSPIRRISNQSVVLDMLLEKIRLTINNKKVSDKTLFRIRDKIMYRVGSKTVILSSLKDIQEPKSWNNSVSNWNIDNSMFISINNLIVLLFVPTFVRILNSRLSSILDNLSYMGPLRATAERYYRRQNLSLDKVDSRGYNLSMFINNLNKTQINSLIDWMKRNFEFYIDADSSGGHISLKLKKLDSDEEFNLADNGFGFSQIMPIIVILWSMTENDKNSRNNRSSKYSEKPKTLLFLIEQPELHLHPRFQAQLTDVFISAINIAKQNNIDLKLILETHSETIINRLGKRIYEGKIDADDTTIALFQNKVDPETQKNVQLAKFNKEGVLENWPLGFFDA